MNPPPEPTKTSERIGSLDFLRGIAILGIVFINIESFVYPNPWSSWQYGYENAVDQNTRFWVYLFIQGKFYTMFALLFGVGFVIFLERIHLKTSGLGVLDLYARRLFWLFLFGLFHAYFIWDGDILYHYAICGFLLLPFRSFKSRNIILTLVFLALILFANSYETMTNRREVFKSYEEALNIPENGRTADETRRIGAWENRYSKKSPDLEEEIENPKPSYWEGVKNSYSKLTVHKGQFYHQSLILSTLIVMLIGMLLYRTGIFTDYKSWKYYWAIALFLLMVGLLINYLRYYQWTYRDHEPVLQIWKAILFTFHKEILGVGYILLFNGIYQKFLRKRELKVISGIGRTALSNYIFQSLVLGIIFYGYGLGQYNNFSRFELLGFILAIWTVQIVFTLVWLKYNKQGPLESIWRKLTYKSFRK